MRENYYHTKDSDQFDPKNIEKLYELTPKQHQAFKALKKAYTDCKKAGILFTNLYSDLVPFNKTIVENYINEDGINGTNEDKLIKVDSKKFFDVLKLPHEWADDTHYLVLTEKGNRILNKE